MGGIWIFSGITQSHLPTLPVFLGVSKFFIKSPDLPVRAPNLPDKMDFWTFLCFSLKFSPFFHKIRTFFIHCTVSGTFLHMFSQWQRLVRHYNDERFWSHVRHVRRHNYNVLRQFVGAGWGVLVLLTFGGGGGGKIESLQILDLQRLAGMHNVVIWATWRFGYLQGNGITFISKSL